MYGYIYKITFPNGMIYIGQKKGNKVRNDYYGSGSLVTIKIKEFGKENLKRDILDWAETPELLNDREIYWIAFFDSTNPDIGYNLSIGGEHRSLGCKFSDEAKEKMSAWQIGKPKSELAKKHMKEAQQKLANDMSPEAMAIRKQRAIKAAETRKNWSNERKLEYSKSLSNGIKGRVASESERLHHSLSMRGKKKSDEHKRNLALAKSKSIFTYGNKTFYTINDLLDYLEEVEDIHTSIYKIRRYISNNSYDGVKKLKYELKEIKKNNRG